MLPQRVFESIIIGERPTKSPQTTPEIPLMNAQVFVFSNVSFCNFQYLFFSYFPYFITTARGVEENHQQKTPAPDDASAQFIYLFTAIAWISTRAFFGKAAAWNAIRAG